ncbi:MAG: phosphatidylglycerophosphatase A [Campylobacterales bacterium]
MNKLFVTVFYSGLFPKAPGTVGTIAALPIGLLALAYLPIETFWLLIVLVFVAGARSIDAYQAATGREDPKEVVIDELAGMWIALALLPDAFAWHQVLLAFLFFRLFDIWKPSIIGKLDSRLKNGYGVMLDDVLAGFFGGIAAVLCIRALEFAGAGF